MKYIVSLILLMGLVACDKSVSETVIEPYAPAKMDEAAGNWLSLIHI